MLVVEDQECVRRLAMAILKARGYRVLEAGSGEEAHSVSMQHAGDVQKPFRPDELPAKVREVLDYRGCS